MSQRPTKKAPRLGMLDALRFVAAIAVVGVHFTSQQSPGWGGPVPAAVEPVGRWTMYGSLGVPLFFVISGFVMLMTAWGRDIPNFVASRVARLFPAYWVAVAFSAVLLLFVWPANLEFFHRSISKTDAAVNLTMVQSALGITDLDGPYWTLIYEAKFYLLMAIFMAFGITRRRVLAFATLWPVIGAVANNTGQGFLSSMLIPDYAPFFAGGMLLYLIYRDGHDLGTWLLVAFQVVIGVDLGVKHYITLGDVTPGTPTQGVLAVLLVGAFAAVAAVTLTPLTRFNKGWMTALGALTYPLYLIHENLGWFVIHGLRDKLSPWAVVAVALVVVLTAATLMHRFVEKPMSGRLRAATLRMLNKTTRETSTPAPQPAATDAPVPVEAPADVLAPLPTSGSPDVTIPPRTRIGVPPQPHRTAPRPHPEPTGPSREALRRPGMHREPAGTDRLS
jgi:peptidoglycan/LPS O-acetylase OafA/YrhL